MNKAKQREAAEIYAETEAKRLELDKAQKEAAIAANTRAQMRQFRAMFVPMAIDALKAQGKPVEIEGIKEWTEAILTYIKEAKDE